VAIAFNFLIILGVRLYNEDIRQELYGTRYFGLIKLDTAEGTRQPLPHHSI